MRPFRFLALPLVATILCLALLSGRGDSQEPTPTEAPAVPPQAAEKVTESQSEAAGERAERLREMVLEIDEVLGGADADLVELAAAGDGAGGLSRLGEGGKEEADEERDDGDDDEEFDEGEGVA